VRSVTAWLASTHGIELVAALGFENAYALAMTRERAAAFGVRAIGDLAAHAPELAIGADYEFLSRCALRISTSISTGALSKRRRACFRHDEVYIMKLEGSCHCQAVRFSVESAHPVPFNLCYCSICRKTNGSGGYGINLGGDYGTLLVEGRENVAVYRARMPEGNGGFTESSCERHFCRRCSSGLGLGARLARPRASVRFGDRYGAAGRARAHAPHARIESRLGARARRQPRQAIRRVPGRIARAMGQRLGLESWAIVSRRPRVNVGIGRTAEALDQRHGAGVGLRARESCFLDQMAGNRTAFCPAGINRCQRCMAQGPAPPRIRQRAPSRMGGEGDVRARAGAVSPRAAGAVKQTSD
jgi:hypothetical protein